MSQYLNNNNINIKDVELFKNNDINFKKRNYNK